MKKSIFSLFVLATSLVACTDDYTDWNAPQHNDQPATVQFGNGSITEVPAINLADVTSETVRVASITAPTADNADYSQATYQLQLGTETMDITTGGEISTAALQQYINDNYGKAPEERDIDAVVTQWLGNGTTTVKTNTSATFKVKATPKAANIEQMYYLAGDMFENGYTKAVIEQNAFTHSATNVWDDPTFKITVTTTEDDQTFMIVPASSLEKSNVLDGAFGCQNEGDDSQSGTLTNEGAQQIHIALSGKYIITVNMESLSYTVEEAPMNLFLTGDRYSWGGTWKQLTPIYGTTDQFWTIIYLHEGEQFKFAPQAGWGGDFGMEATVNDKAGAGIVNEGGNCKATKAGWYLLHVTNGMERVIDVLEPNVYLMGDAVGEWNIVPAGKFTVPSTDDGEFVSPAFAKDCELRMCVSLDGFDWWKTEFIIANGDIDYRGRGGDQDRLNVTAGQKAYLNFATGKAEVK